VVAIVVPQALGYNVVADIHCQVGLGRINEVVKYAKGASPQKKYNQQTDIERCNRPFTISTRQTTRRLYVRGEK
jgi:hypothetical protein